MKNKGVSILMAFLLIIMSAFSVNPFHVNAEEVYYTEEQIESNGINPFENISNLQLITTGAKDETYEQAARYVPNYVITDSNTIQPLYNPYTAQMLLDLSLDAYQISANNTEGWQRSLIDLGYTTRICIDGEKSYDIAEIDNGEGVPPTAISFNPFHAIIGIKKVVYNDQVKYAFVIAFRGTNSFGDLVDTDFNFLPTSEGFHSGFRNMSRDFMFYFRTKQFTLDGNTVLGDDILKDMQNENSKYTMLVTGHSLGGALTDILVGYDFYEMGVHPSNVMAYTFAAPTSAPSYYNYPYKNIINIVNEDDFVPTVGASKRVGIDFRYTPDDAFRQAHYKNHYEEGHGTAWWSNIVNEAFHFVSHDLDKVYNPIIDYIQNHIDNYTSYHTNGDIVWSYVRLSENTYNIYSGCINTNSLVIDNSELTCNKITFSNELKIENDCRINGSVDCGDTDYARVFLGRPGLTTSTKSATLIVEGDLSCNQFLMENTDNYLFVGGNLRRKKTYDYAGTMNGIIECKGDFYYNTPYKVNGTVIFSGTSIQRISGEYFNRFQFNNPNIVFENNKIEFTLETDTSFSASSVLDIGIVYLNNCTLTALTDINCSYLSLVNSKVICQANDINTAGITLDNSELTCNKITFSNELKIENDCRINGSVDCGDTDYARVFLGRPGLTTSTKSATLIVEGDLSCNQFLMENTDNYLFVGGNLRRKKTYDYAGTMNGIIECKGDFYYNSTYRLGGRVVLSGAHAQIVYGSYLSEIINNNQSEKGIIFERNINVSILFDHRGNRFTLYNNGVGSTFVDYDGDGTLDNDDPYPTDPNNTPPTQEPTQAPTQEPSYSPMLLGDVDGDGTVTIIDATCIQRHLASIPTFAFIEAVADTDCDGGVTILDATYIQRWLAQLPSNKNIGKPIA